MKTINKIVGLLTLTLVMASFSQCSSAQKLQKKAPTTFGEVYFQKWVSGVAGGGSGINIFVETLTDNVQLDSVYFRGRAAKFEVKPANKLLYIGRFLTDSNKNEHMIMSSDTNQEYGNKAPIIPSKIPFELKDNECVISYLSNNQTKYFKIENIEERRSKNYPMAPQSDNN
jgi:hypothetical protein